MELKNCYSKLSLTKAADKYKQGLNDSLRSALSDVPLCDTANISGIINSYMVVSPIFDDYYDYLKCYLESIGIKQFSMMVDIYEGVYMEDHLQFWKLALVPTTSGYSLYEFVVELDGEKFRRISGIDLSLAQIKSKLKEMVRKVTHNDYEGNFINPYWADRHPKVMYSIYKNYKNIRAYTFDELVKNLLDQ